MSVKYLVTAREMKRCDSCTIHSLGIPGEVLMERAALKVVEAIQAFYPGGKLTEKKILIAAGGGNNGGDGLAIARLLADMGCRTDAVFMGDRDHAPGETALQLRILENYDLSPVSIFPEKEYDIIVDALFGIGLSRTVEGKYLDAVTRINESRAWKVAVDIPSGVDADTGQIHGCAVQADLTVTFGWVKRGLMYYPGNEYAGRIVCADIGINERSFGGELPAMYTLEGSPGEFLPRRRPDGNKGTFGKVLLFAGSENMAGAAVLCGKGLLRSGAGMVKICTCESNRLVLQEVLPEAMLLTYTRADEVRQGNMTLQAELEKALCWADCIVAGPGIGTEKSAEQILEWLLAGGKKPIVLDADGLNLLAKSEKLAQILVESVKETGREVILTPHVGELSRLLGCSINEIKDSPEEKARRAAKKYQAVIVSKDARTLVCGESGPVFLNTAGNSGMATAGSGDVLAGVIGALLAGGMGSLNSAVAGTYLHACAGDLAAQKVGEAGLMASDLIQALAAIQKG